MSPRCAVPLPGIVVSNMSTSAQKICPYCGSPEQAGSVCGSCGGLLDHASRAATAQDIGPWFVRNADRPFFPGCTDARLRRMIRDGQLRRDSIVRGPTTGGFWLPADRVPGLAQMLGFCHACEGMVGSDDPTCPRCGVPLGLEHQLPVGGARVESSSMDAAVELIKHAQYKKISRLQSQVRFQAIALAVCIGVVFVGMVVYLTGLLEQESLAPVAIEAVSPSVETAPSFGDQVEMSGAPEDAPATSDEFETPDAPVAPAPVEEVVVIEDPPMDPVDATKQQLLEQLHAVTPEQAALIGRLGALMEVSKVPSGPVAERLQATEEAFRLIDEALVDEQDGFMRLRLQALREVFEKDRRRIELEATMGE